MFKRLKSLILRQRGTGQLSFRQIEIYSNQTNVALGSEVIVHTLETGSSANNMIDGIIKDDKTTTTKKMLDPSITINFTPALITNVIIYAAKNFVMPNVEVFYIEEGKEQMERWQVIPRIPAKDNWQYEFAPTIFVNTRTKSPPEEVEAIARKLYNAYQINGNILAPTAVKFATPEEIMKIVHRFQNAKQIIHLIQKEAETFCRANPSHESCGLMCDPLSDSPFCKDINYAYCSQPGAYGSRFCTNYIIQNKRYDIDRQNEICKNIDELTNLPVCEGLYPRTENDRETNIKYNQICRDSSDKRCTCINHKLLLENRELAIKEQLDLPKKKITDDIEKRVKELEKEGKIKEAQILRAKIPSVLDKIEEYYRFVAFGLTPVSSQCIIPACRDNQYKSTEKCELNTFVLAVCFNTIDVNALENNIIRFTNTSQQCQQTITLGRCLNDKTCPHGYVCNKGQCQVGCNTTDKKCNLPGYGCVNGFCVKTESQEENKDWLLYLIIFLILVIIVIIALMLMW